MISRENDEKRSGSCKCPQQVQLFVHCIFSRQQIAYNASADPEAQEKIQRRAERFKSSLNQQRSTTPSILNTLQTMVRISFLNCKFCSFW